MMKILPGIFCKKIITVTAMGAMVFIAVAATTAPKGKFKNLKVLRDNISDKDLSAIMVNDFTDGLGVSCGFCHAPEPGSQKLDYASDANPQKENARKMMRMTLGINKKYLKIRHAEIGDSVLRVTCTTCHNGKPYPGE
jgi:hypothetical protein